jgi:hypothetical protein
MHFCIFPSCWLIEPHNSHSSLSPNFVSSTPSPYNGVMSDNWQEHAVLVTCALSPVTWSNWNCLVFWKKMTLDKILTLWTSSRQLWFHAIKDNKLICVYISLPHLRASSNESLGDDYKKHKQTLGKIQRKTKFWYITILLKFFLIKNSNNHKLKLLVLLRALK